MRVNRDHVKDLVEIIVRHGQLENFGFHLVYRRDPISNDKVRLESNLAEIESSKWSKDISIDSLDLRNIHPVAIKFVPEQNQLVPFKFGEGPSPVSASDVVDRFIKEFTTYLIKHNLSDIFALGIVHPAEGGQSNECTAQVEADKFGTIVVPKSRVNTKESLPMEWPGPPQPGDNEPSTGQN